MRIITAFITFCISFTVAAAEPSSASGNSCIYSYKPGTVKVFWTGYKFTEKKGAKGEFKDVTITASPTAKSVEELILSTVIDIDTLKTETGDPGRDYNLINSFFKKMKGTQIKGTVESFQSDILKVKTQMNGITKTLAFRVHIDGNKYKADTGFDIIDLFKMKKAHESISKTCYEVHKGPDGKSKTWTQVNVELEGEIMNSCQAGAK